MKSLKYLFLVGFFISCSMNQANAGSDFNLKSSDVKKDKTIDDKHVFDGFGCSGKNISPQLIWQNAPKNTQSFAVTVYDPDAPTGSGWWHWVVVNILKTQNELLADFGKKDEASLKDGVTQVRNDFGAYKFGGPCPPKGDKPHRYIFTVYALKVENLDLPKDATAALAGFMIKKNTIAQASFTSHYSR